MARPFPGRRACLATLTISFLLLPLFGTDLHLAWTNHPELRVARGAWKSAEAGVASAFSLPGAWVGVEFAGSDKTVVVNQEIPFPTKPLLATLAADARAKAEKSRWLEKAAEVRAAWRSLRARGWAVERSLGEIDSSMLLARELVNLLKFQYAGGKGLPSDILRGEAEIQSLQSLRRRMAADLEAMNAEAVRFAGPSRESFSNLWSRPEVPTNAPGREEFLRAVLSNQAGFATRRWMSAEASAEASRAAWEFVPDFQLEGRASTTPGSSSATIMLQAELPWPLWRKISEAARAGAEMEKARAEENAWRTEAISRAESAWARFRSERENLVTAEQASLPLAREIALLSENEYRSGKGDFARVVEARRRALEAGVEAFRTRGEAASAWAELERWSAAPIDPTLASKMNTERKIP